jgi:hypothetical protein
MKKTLLTIALSLGFATSAQASWISYDVDQVKADAKGGKDSTAHYFRAGFSAAGLDTMIQARSAAFDGGGLVHSVEATVGKPIGMLTPFVGVGHDLGFNGAKSFNYGLIGASTGMKIGPLWGYAGAKTRLNFDDANPKQTVRFIGASLPVSKKLSVNAGYSKSTQDIREHAVGIGARLSF